MLDMSNALTFGYCLLQLTIDILQACTQLDITHFEKVIKNSSTKYRILLRTEVWCHLASQQIYIVNSKIKFGLKHMFCFRNYFDLLNVCIVHSNMFNF